MKTLLRSLEMNLESVSETSTQQAKLIIEQAQLIKELREELEKTNQKLNQETNAKKAYKGQLETIKQLGV